jgi:hypothetical protein
MALPTSPSMLRASMVVCLYVHSMWSPRNESARRTHPKGEDMASITRRSRVVPGTYALSNISRSVPDRSCQKSLEWGRQLGVAGRQSRDQALARSFFRERRGFFRDVKAAARIGQIWTRLFSFRLGLGLFQTDGSGVRPVVRSGATVPEMTNCWPSRSDNH